MIKDGPCPPGVRWTPLAYALVIGICAASAVCWFLLIASTVALFGEFAAAQADIAVRLAELASPGACGEVVPAPAGWVAP